MVGGALFMRAVREGGATLLPIDSEHSAIFQCLPEDRARLARRASTTSCSPPPAGRSATRDPATLARRDARRGLRASELGDGPQDLGRLGDDDEQGARGDRGALAVRPARPSRSRVVIHPQSIIHSMVVCRDALGARAARHARHAGADRLRPGVARAHRIGREPARLRDARRADLRGGRRARASPACSWPGTRCAAPEGTTAVLNAANEVAVAAFLRRNHPLRRRFTAVNADTIDAACSARPASAASLDAPARARCARAAARRSRS